MARMPLCASPSSPPAAPLVRGDAACYQLPDVLAQDIGVAGAVSGWPATAPCYANCTGL